MAQKDGVAVVTREDIAAGVRRAYVIEGDLVLVHSSLSSLGHVEGGADAVIDALLDVVGKAGTVAFPTFTGSSELSAENPPVFYPHFTPCWTGLIPETARKRPEAIRSLGPTHSVCAIGARAEWLTMEHQACETPCGIGSPFDKLRQTNGKILFIGTDLSCNTLFHHVEEIAQAPYVCVDEPVAAKVVLDDGTVIDAPLRIHAYGPARDYTKFEPELRDRRILETSSAGNAELRVLRARQFCELMIPRVQKDPSILLARPEG